MFGALRSALGKSLKVKNAILDGEVICIDPDGRSNFSSLIRRRSKPMFYAFDLIWLNGTDLRKLPLIERKKRLRKLLPRRNAHLLLAHHVEAEGKRLFQLICGQDLEGIVAKKKSSTYSERGWLKIKNSSYTQAHDRKDFFKPRSK
jgi:bifunctional non-homologous end joining protein LigD